MNDRLEDILDDTYESDDSLIGNLDISFSGKGPQYDKSVPEDSLFLRTFHEEVEEVGKLLDDLSDNKLSKFKDRIATMFSFLDPQDLKPLRDDLNKDFQTINTRLSEFDINLQDIKEKYFKDNKIEVSSETSFKTAEYRIKETNVIELKKRFAELLSRYHELESVLRSKRNNEIKRKMKIINGSECEVDENINQDDIDKMMLRKIDVKSLKKVVGKSTVATVDTELGIAREMRDELEELDASMNEFTDMLRDMVCLVETQGERIDMIESNVEHTAEYVNRGIKSVRKAKYWTKKSKCLCGTAIILSFVVSLFVLVGVVATFSVIKVIS